MMRHNCLAVCVASAALLFSLKGNAEDAANIAVSGTTNAETPDTWRDNGRVAAERAMEVSHLTDARNVILFVGDGMSIPTVTAARILQGQQRGESGEGNSLSFERFPSTALSKTYTTDSLTGESAGTMTAMMTGVKTRSGSLSVDEAVERGTCKGSEGHTLLTLLESAEQAGLKTGVVTTTTITHATPGATYAHVSERNWESDAEMSDQAIAEGCKDIARQLVEFPYGDGIDVALGGGRQFFLPRALKDPEKPDASGYRKDGRDLTKAWLKRYPKGKYVWNLKQFDAVDSRKAEHVLGLFNPSHMEFQADRAKDLAGEPSLKDMTVKAIEVLRRSKKGFFLMVESGRIDHGHHAGNAYRALIDTIALSDAVAAARELTSDEDTLIVVTADHSHTLSIVGYPRRGNPILGLVEEGPGKLAHDAMGLPYTVLSYANGPGYLGASDSQPEGSKVFPNLAKSFSGITKGRPMLTEELVSAPGYLQESAVPSGAETHGGDDVAVFASGPGAQGFHGVLEQNVIYWLMRQAFAKTLGAAAAP